MSALRLFVDGSFDPGSKVGVGAYLLVPEVMKAQDIEEKSVMVKRFEGTSSTRLELETLLWVWTEVGDAAQPIITYTDSQNIIRLPKRRERLEAKGFLNQEGKRLKHECLYRDFYRMWDQVDRQCIQVSGHLRAEEKDEIDQLFQWVDRVSRKALRLAVGRGGQR